MILREIVRGIDILRSYGYDGLEISGISFDSQLIQEGFLFVALKGEKTDGHKYIESAVKNGAKALIVEKAPDAAYPGVSVIEVADSRTSLAAAAANFYGHPTKELSLVGVTGTNGKTTVTYLLESIWNYECKKAGVIGTKEKRKGG